MTSPRSNASSDHSYAKLSANGAEEDASTAASSQSSSQSSLVGISSNNEESESNEEEKSSEEKLKQDINVKKLTAHDLFRDYEPVDDFNFDVSDSEYPELEQDEENERESSENSTQDETITVQQKPDAEKKVKEKIPEDKKKVLKEEEELKEKQNEENSADSTDMELDEELMAMNRTIINEEKAPESTDLDAKTISTEENSQLSSQSSSETGKSEFVSQTASEPSEAASEPSEEASQSVQAASQTSSDIDSASSSSACAKSTKKRRKNCRFTIEMIKEVIKLKEQMISEKAKLLDAILEKEKRRVAKRKEAKKLEASKSEDSEENLMEEVKKRPSTKIKLPSAKKPRVELKEIVIKQEKEDFEGFKGFDRSEVEDLNDITIIPYQCGVLSPPTVVRKTREVAEAPEIRSTLEIRPPEVRAPPKWKQSNIANMSFVKLKRGFMVKCNVDGCRFQSLIKETLKDHLEKKHSDKDWTGFCNICEQNVRLRKGSVLDEFAHMEFHMESPEKAENDDRFNDFPAFSKNSSVFPAPSKNLSVFPAFTKTSSVFLSPNSLPDSSSIAPAKSALEMYLTAEAPAPVARKPPKAQSPKKIKKLGRPRKVISPPKKAPIKPPALVYTPPPDVYTPAPATESDDSTSILSKLLSSSSFQPNIGGKLIKPPDCLRPWLKSESLKNSEQAKAMLNSKEALAATYKCMSTTCSFFTIDRELFLKHLSLHEKFTVSDKQNFLACSYCKFVAKKPASLADHVDNEHCHDQFQCNYCFYRACTVFSVTTHQSLFHQFQPSIILECDLIKPRDTRAHLEKVAQLRAEYVPPMICVFCRGIFFVMQAFKEHLFRHSDEPIQHAQCVKCGKKATNLQVRGHLEGCHGIGTFQCVYCSFGTESFDKLNNHIVNKHASKIPVYCERVWNENPDGTHKHVSFDQIYKLLVIFYSNLLNFNLDFSFDG